MIRKDAGLSKRRSKRRIQFINENDFRVFADVNGIKLRRRNDRHDAPKQ